MNKLFLSLGTNLGQRRLKLQQAVAGLKRGMVITAVSPVYETAPWGVVDQPGFLNICVAASTTQSPHTVLNFIKTIEVELGRQPAKRWRPRLIDVDILFYDDLVLQDEQLTVPHPHIAQRAFVLAPLADIAPEFVHPQTGQTVAQMLTAVSTTSVCQLPDPLFQRQRDWRAEIGN